MIGFDTKYIHGFKNSCCNDRLNIDYTSLKGLYKCNVCNSYLISYPKL